MDWNPGREAGRKEGPRCAYDLSWTPQHDTANLSLPACRTGTALPRAMGYISVKSESAARSRHTNAPIMQPNLRFEETQNLSPLKANKLSINPEP